MLVSAVGLPDFYCFRYLAFFFQIHATGFFLPWHRLYLQTWEDELRSKCGYTGVQPYWDWTQGNALG